MANSATRKIGYFSLRNSSCFSKGRGQIAVFTLLLMGVVVLFMMVLTGALLSDAASVGHAADQSLSQQLAESGIDKAIWCLNHPTIAGCVNYTGETSNQGAGSYSVNITSLGGNQDRITSTATINGQTRTITQLVSTQQASDNVAFSYAVQIGAGGVEMENGSSINGSIFSNGTIDAQGNVISGDATVASSITLGNSYTTQNGDYQFGKSDNITDPSQSFSPTATSTITQVSLFLKKSGSPSDKTVYLVTDNAGSPSKVSVASGTLKGSSVTTSAYAWVDIPLSPTPQLIAGTRYWIVVDSSNSSSNYYIWGYDTAGGNALDVSKYSPNWNPSGTPSWTSVTGDFNYKTWYGGTATAIDQAQVGGNAQAYSITNTSQIKGDASYMTIDSGSLNWLNDYAVSPGVAHPNTLPPGSMAFSITDAIINDWKNDATAGGVYSGGCPYTLTNNASATISTPLEIDCDVTISNNAVLTINTPLWIKGNLTVSNNSAIVLASTYGTGSGVIVVDVPGSTATKGTVLLNNNVAVCGSAGYNAGTKVCNPSTNGSYLMILSTYSGSGKAIDISNNADGAILYAPYGTVDVENGVTLKEVSAYKLKLEQNASVTYETGLQSVNFVNGPGGAWKPTPHTWQQLRAGVAPGGANANGNANSSPNVSPVLDPIGDKTATAGNELAFTVSGSDPENDPLTFSATDLPNGATFTNQVFSWTPSSGQTGAFSVTFSVSDGVRSDSETITITSTATDQTPPTPPTSMTFIGGTSYNIIDLAWSGMTDAEGLGDITQYVLYRCSGADCTSATPYATTSAASYHQINLTVGTVYGYAVVAKDAWGNVSPLSSWFYVQTGTKYNPGPIPLARTFPDARNPLERAFAFWSSSRARS